MPEIGREPALMDRPAAHRDNPILRTPARSREMRQRHISAVPDGEDFVTDLASVLA
jgi:hypothetical protein